MNMRAQDAEWTMSASAGPDKMITLLHTSQCPATPLQTGGHWSRLEAGLDTGSRLGWDKVQRGAEWEYCEAQCISSWKYLYIYHLESGPRYWKEAALWRVAAAVSIRDN